MLATQRPDSILTWNPHPRDPETGQFLRGGRLEGTFMGVEMTLNTVYQFDCARGPYGRSLTPGVFTGVWDGTIDSEGYPLFRHVDDRTIVRRPYGATWFDTLENLGGIHG